MRTHSLFLLVASLVMAGAGCSSSGNSSDKDSGVEGDGDGDNGDGDGDSGDGDSGDGDRPRIDAGPVLGDAVPPCDPFEPDDCAAGQKCDVVIRRNPTADGFDIYTGCVDGVSGRGEGDPCIPWNDFATPYETEGLFDEVHVDPCEQGLLCAPDPTIRGLNTCQVSCQSGRFSGFPPFGCSGTGQYCQSVDPSNADPFREVCRESDACDPKAPAECGGGQSCYLRTNDTGTAVLSECLPVPEEPVADSEACQFFNDCEAGSVCWGPVRVPPNAWTGDNVACRPICALDGDDDDAGVGGCPGDTKCVPFADSGLNLDGIPHSFGQCE